MGISRDSTHKRRLTGGRMNAYRKKRKYQLGRPPASTKLGPRRIHTVRVRGGNYKFRALRLENGNYSWGSESITRKTRILGVTYNASNNELVRTNTLVKSAVVQIDATPFRQWYEQHYGIQIGKKKKTEGETTTTGGETTTAAPEPEKKKKSTKKLAKLAARQKTRTLETALDEQFTTGRIYAIISSRPGQSGRADGYILEGKELEFYLRKMQKGKKAQKQ